jgi:hypothetical protein
VGPITAVFVRDSSPIRTKSDRTDSCVSWSTMRVRVERPATPVAITGVPSSRAELDHLYGGVADPLHGVEAEADVAVDDHELVV